MKPSYSYCPKDFSKADGLCTHRMIVLGIAYRFTSILHPRGRLIQALFQGNTKEMITLLCTNSNFIATRGYKRIYITKRILTFEPFSGDPWIVKWAFLVAARRFLATDRDSGIGYPL